MDTLRPVASGHPRLVDVTMFWSARSGGVARYLRSKREWLATRSHWSHTILVPGPFTGETSSIPSIPLPFSGGYRFPLRRSGIAEVIVRHGPDLIEVGDPYRCAWAALDAGQKLGVPTTAFYHSNVPALVEQWLPRAGRATVRRYLRHLYHNFDAVFAPSRWAVDALRDLGLDNVVLQAHGADCNLFHPRRYDQAWRRELGYAPSDIVLLYAGRFAPEKNLERLAAAVDALGAPYRLVAIGAGPRSPRGSRLRVLPYEPDANHLARALASADIFVHAGDQETFGLAALEALACGTPVVARASGGLMDLIDDVAAVGVSRNDTAAFAEAIAAMAPVAGRLRAEARRRALEFDADRAFSQLLSRYTALCFAARSIEARPHEQRYAA